MYWLRAGDYQSPTSAIKRVRHDWNCSMFALVVYWFLRILFTNLAALFFVATFEFGRLTHRTVVRYPPRVWFLHSEFKSSLANNPLPKHEYMESPAGPYEDKPEENSHQKSPRLCN